MVRACWPDREVDGEGDADGGLLPDDGDPDFGAAGMYHDLPPA